MLGLGLGPWPRSGACAPQSANVRHRRAGGGSGGATGRAKRLGGSGASGGASPECQESQGFTHPSTGRGQAGGLQRSPGGPPQVSMLRRISMGSLRLVALPPLP